MIRIAGSVSKSWLAQRLPVAFDREYYLDPRRRHAIDRQCNDFVARELGRLGVFYTESNLGRIEWYDANQVLVGGIQPNMIVGMLLGADLLARNDADADISPRCLAGRDPRGLPDPTSLLEHSWVRRWTDELATLAAEMSTELCPIPPFFWDRSGRAAVHGALTTGLKFWGDEFLISSLADPAWCEQAITWLTEVSACLVAHFARVAGVTVTGIHVGECAACMVDEQTFRRFVVPATSRLGDQFGAVRFHSCGRSDHLLEACAEIRQLASLDVGGETSVATIRARFGRDFPIGIAPLVDQMKVTRSDAILDWFARVARENAGGDLTIGYHLEADYHLETLEALHEAVARGT
jgi:hypothetical protein